MEDILINVNLEPDSLIDKTFDSIIILLGFRNQIKMNHWQTASYAEHKMTDDLIESLDDFIDQLAESTIGSYGRPKINTKINNLSDNSITSTTYALSCISKCICELLQAYEQTNNEGLIALLGDFDANIKKFIFLNTLK